MGALLTFRVYLRSDWVVFLRAQLRARERIAVRIKEAFMTRHSANAAPTVPRSSVLCALTFTSTLLFACGTGNKTVGIPVDDDGGAGAGTGAGAGSGSGAGAASGAAKGGASGTAGTGGASGGAGTSGASGTGAARADGAVAGSGQTSAGGTVVMTVPGVVTTPSFCPVIPSQCSDGKDNDNDGKIDALDPECVGPCDNDEGSYATGIPGDNVDACKQDCFFDGDSGAGNDGCDWNLKCDPANPGKYATKVCEYDPRFAMQGKNCDATPTQKCLDTCRAITPNGCDCFGCCSVPVNGTQVSVKLQPSCTAAKFGDPVACPRCTQVASCQNTCEKCEICVGKPMLDPSCPTVMQPPPPVVMQPTPPPPGVDAAPTPPAPPPPPPGPTPVCPAGFVTCGAGGQVAATNCATGFYCLTGCCIRYIP